MSILSILQVAVNIIHVVFHKQCIQYNSYYTLQDQRKSREADFLSISEFAYGW